jgi:hypothetical protein
MSLHCLLGHVEPRKSDPIKKCGSRSARLRIQFAVVFPKMVSQLLYRHVRAFWNGRRSQMRAQRMSVRMRPTVAVVLCVTSLIRR